jgi:LacI family transcriptional regulator
MEDLGFVRNASARQLRAGVSSTVGAVMLDLFNPFFSEIIRGINSQLAKKGLVLVLCSSNNSVQTELRQLRTLEEERVLGILVTPLSRDMGQIDALRRRGTRVVLLDRADPRTDICSVSVDHTRGGELAVEHLLSQGHSRVGFINGPRSLRQFGERHRGALRAARNFGLDPGKTIVEVSVRAANPEGGQQGVAMLIEAGLPSAIFCVNDYVALGAVRALRANKLSVPGEVAVVGYDDIEFASMLSPALTSVRQPMYELGKRATTLLMEEASDGEHRHQQVRFTPELVVRASSGA